MAQGDAGAHEHALQGNGVKALYRCHTGCEVRLQRRAICMGARTWYRWWHSRFILGNKRAQLFERQVGNLSNTVANQRGTP